MDPESIRLIVGVILIVFGLVGKIDLKQGSMSTRNLFAKITMFILGFLIIFEADKKFLRWCCPPEVESLNVSISTPVEGDIIEADSYSQMNGTFEGVLPDSLTLRVLAKDEYSYFIVDPAPILDPTQFTWKQSNVRLSTPGKWELIVYVSNQSASDSLRNWVKANGYAGFSVPPNGMKPLCRVRVRRQ